MLHKDHKPIKAEGFGYKIFSRREKSGNPVSLCDRRAYISDSEWIKWGWGPGGGGAVGFCFFTNLREAKRSLNLWKPCGWEHIRKIQYKGGLGKHIERGFISGKNIAIALCQSFKILDEVKDAKKRKRQA
jgi:hypothetical protein